MIIGAVVSTTLNIIVLVQPKLLVKVIVVSPTEFPITFPSALIEHTNEFVELQEETPLDEVKITSSPISSII